MPDGGDPAGTGAGRILERTRIRRGCRQGDGRLASGSDCGVTGIADGVVDDVVAVRTVNTDPVAFGRLVGTEEGRGPGTWRWRRWHRLEEETADHGVGSANRRERDHHVTADHPGIVDPSAERRRCLGIEHSAIGGIGELDLLARPTFAQSTAYKRGIVGLTIGQVDVHGKDGRGAQHAAVRPTPLRISEPAGPSCLQQT